MKKAMEFIEWSTLLISTVVILIAVVTQHSAVLDSLQNLYARTGLAVFVLVPLTIALFAVIINAWLTSDWHSDLTKRTLGVVAVLGPMAGFLGTTIGLMQAIDALGQARSLDALLEMVGHTFKGMGQAFSTTVWGLILAIVATLILRIRGIDPDAPEPNRAPSTSGHDLQKQSRPDSSSSSIQEATTDMDTTDEPAPGQLDGELNQLKLALAELEAAHECWMNTINPYLEQACEGDSDDHETITKTANTFALPNLDTDQIIALFRPPIYAPQLVQDAFERKGVTGLKILHEPRPAGVTVSTYISKVPDEVSLSLLQAVCADVANVIGAKSVRVSSHDEPGTVEIEVDSKTAPEKTSPLKSALGRLDIQHEFKKPGIRALIGQDSKGVPLSVDVLKENVLIGGTSGSGKSNTLHQVIIGFVCFYSPAELQLDLADPHGVELAGYADLPHTHDFASTSEDIRKLLINNMKEMRSRYFKFEEGRYLDIHDYNRDPVNSGNRTLPIRVIIIDELAAVATKQNMPLIELIAQEGRKAGIRLILATQAPRKDFLSGPTRANCQARLCHKTMSSLESRLVLDNSANAHALQHPGEAYFSSRETFGNPERIIAFEAGAEFINEVQRSWRS